MENIKIGLGGSCHWCTEAIFQSLRGVTKVDQGWISALEESSFSEAVIVHFDDSSIDLSVLIEIHLRTHSCTSNHPMREKYRSAIYAFSKDQYEISSRILDSLQPQFEEKIITQVLYFEDFRLNKEKYLNYYINNPDKPFCQNIIDPKLDILRRDYHTNLR